MPQVALLGPNTIGLLVPHDAFFAVYNCFTFVGDALSRQLVYRATRLAHPLLFLAFSAVGVFLCLIKVRGACNVRNGSSTKRMSRVQRLFVTYVTHVTSIRCRSSPRSAFSWSSLVTALSTPRRRAG